MSAASNILPKPAKKYVLQQSNFNLDIANGKEDHKLLEKQFFVNQIKEEMLETENQFSPQKRLDKTGKSDAKKLRSIRLDLSSLKRSVIHKPKTDFSEEDSSEDEGKRKRKPRPVVPNYVTNSDSGPCRKPRQSRQDPLLLSSQNSPKPKAQPLSIARRNARERNRVKQVNEGFATLRSRIPEYISDAYNEEKGRKTAKKLSKVETLRMAVDYIRHLETLLDIKSEGVWMQDGTESQPWETPGSSVDYPSPVESKYQTTCAESPGPSYDQGFEYQERIFYDYDLDFMGRKDVHCDRKLGEFAFIKNEGDSQCEDDFKYYETFNRLKKEGIENVNDENFQGEVDEEELEKEENESELTLLPKAKDVIAKKTVLPSITETFNKGIPVFF